MFEPKTLEGLVAQQNQCEAPCFKTVSFIQTSETSALLEHLVFYFWLVSFMWSNSLVLRHIAILKDTNNYNSHILNLAPGERCPPDPPLGGVAARQTSPHLGPRAATQTLSLGGRRASRAAAAPARAAPEPCQRIVKTNTLQYNAV